MTPLDDPTTLTDAPIMGSPSSAEVTLPVTCVCANAAPTLRSRQARNIVSLFFINTLSKKLINYTIYLYFDANLNLTISIKEPYLNHIFIMDTSTRFSVEKGKVNFNMLFTILKNVVPLLDNHNNKDVSIRIMSI